MKRKIRYRWLITPSHVLDSLMAASKPKPKSVDELSSMSEDTAVKGRLSSDSVRFPVSRNLVILPLTLGWSMILNERYKNGLNPVS